MNTLRATPVYRDTTTSIFAVESVSVTTHQTTTSCQLFASVRPVAIVIRTAERTYALDTASRPTDLDELKRQLPADVEALTNPGGQLQ